MGEIAQPQPAGTYALGHKPYWELVIAGGTRFRRGVHQKGLQHPNMRDYRIAMDRLDVELGIDEVHTCTFDLLGEDAAKFATETLPRGTKIAVRVGYEDTDSEPFTVFKGTVLQAYPESLAPLIVTVQADSDLYKAREAWITGDDTTTEERAALANIIEAETQLATNFVDFEIEKQGEGAKIEGNLLKLLQGFNERNGLHMIDDMDGKLQFLAPYSSVEILGSPNRKWEFGIRADPASPNVAPILTEWGVQINWVDSPRRIVAGYYHAEDDADDISVQLVEAENENGVEGTTHFLGVLPGAKDAEAAQAVVDAWAQNYYWKSVHGPFRLATGVPMLPFDIIVARRGPAGLEAFFDKQLRVERVHHIFDSRGWTVTGNVRGVLESA